MAEDPKAELYRFVKDRHDKFLQARQGQMTRIGHLLVITGFVVTVLLVIGLPRLLEAAREAHAWWSWTLYGLTVLAFGITLTLLWLTFREHLRFLGRLAFAVPYADPVKIMGAFDAQKIQEGHVYKSLTKMYLDAIEENQIESAYAGKHLRRIVQYLSAAMVAGVVFLALLVFSKILA